ncbi:hypothetical protein CHS0354_023428 [Potamilus streckersoni]|uniref:Piwi n=1 Tax=Potamilus streckersoni TaxID=2493646 RepID=A0AAE0RYT5_9BIVA|nr:hypothetical protein CHS0354_023428 [Potamilus streckersoni]
MSGRPRGRAYGRARGGIDEQRARRPGEVEQAAAVQPPPVMQPRQPQVQPSSSGSPSGHGGASESHPQLPTELSAMTIGTRAAPEVGFITRPSHIVNKQGSAGRQLPLITNYFRLERAPDWHIYQYHVDFNPVVESKKMRIALLYHHEKMLGRTKAFDGMVLFLPFRLLKQTTEVFTKRNTDDVFIRIRITMTNELPPNSLQCLQVYNIIFKRVLTMIDMKQIGRNYYNPSLAKTFDEHKLMVLPGFITSILQYENDVLLNCDISHKIMRSDSVLDQINDILRLNKDRFHDNATWLLVGSIVLTSYNNRTYKVDGIAWNKRPTDTFKLHDGSEITYKDYYKRNYEINITNSSQPLLVSKPKEKDIRGGQKNDIYLVPELCKMTGLTDKARANRSLMKDVSVFTRVVPDKRYEVLSGFVRKINSNQNVRTMMEDWRLRFSQNIMNLVGRILPEEQVYQKKKDNVSICKQEDANWSQQLREMQQITAVDLDKWLFISPSKYNGNAKDFVDSLIKVGLPMGIKILQPIYCVINNENIDTYISTMQNSITENTQLVMCLLPTNKKDRYDAIKKFTCVETPVPSQIIVMRTLEKRDISSIATKVAIQLNCKLGGEVWTLSIPIKNFMVIGMDVFHDSTAEGRSVAGIVSSLNPKLTKYYSRVIFQNRRQELVHDLATPLIDTLQKYHEVNGILPKCIIVYRDGVGDGQLRAVLDLEVSQILKIFNKVGGPNYKPQFAVVIVKKRINTRFFASTKRPLINPPPGTVIDTVVTKAEWYDFFLVSQSVKQGTLSPTHYNVIKDTTNLTPDHMQKLTYKLCHLYYNWPGTISVPAPCQYAHKLAFLVGQSVHVDPALQLADKLYFL